ncbi:MAG: transporter substrate-binding domain-containing protein [Caldimonas sp.]
MKREALLAAVLVAAMSLPGPAAAQTVAPAQPVAPDGTRPLAVCVAEDNAPLSLAEGAKVRGLDIELAAAIAAELQRPLAVVPFESKYEADSTLSQEVNALLSSQVCELASGFALLRADLGAPSRPTARVPDYPGAKRPPQRPWVPLGTLAPSHAYHAMAMALIVRDASRAGATLADPGDARIGAITGTLGGTVVSLFRNGKLRAQMVTLSQKQDALEELEAGRIDAALVAVDRFDAWRLAHPATTMVRTAYVHPLRINIGFVARIESREVLAAADRVIDRALASGELQRWHAAAGSSWIAPADPQVSAMVGLAELIRE